MELGDSSYERIEKYLFLATHYIISDILDEIDPYDICVGIPMTHACDIYSICIWKEVRTQSTILKQFRILIIGKSSIVRITIISSDEDEADREDAQDILMKHIYFEYYIPTPSSVSDSISDLASGAFGSCIFCA
jgi:hypothetical protein